MRSLYEQKKNMEKRFQIMSVLLIYLMVVSANVFFLPVITSAPGSTPYSAFARTIENLQPVKYVERTDKAIVKETLNITSSILLLTCLAVLISGFRFKDPNIGAILSNVRLLQNQRYSYLSFCVFRIWCLYIGFQSNNPFFPNRNKRHSILLSCFYVPLSGP